MVVFVLAATDFDRFRLFGKVQHSPIVSLLDRRDDLLQRVLNVFGFHLFQRLNQKFKFRDFLLFRKKHFRFDIQQIGCHLNEFAGDLKIHFFHLVKIFGILIQNIRDHNITDFDLILLQQHENQCQRTLEILNIIFSFQNTFKMVCKIFH